MHTYKHDNSDKARLYVKDTILTKNKNILLI